MGGVGGVLHDAVGFAGASCKENVQDGWERGTDDLCSRVHCRTRIVVKRFQSEWWMKLSPLRKLVLSPPQLGLER